MNIGKGSGSVVERHADKEHADSSDRKRVKEMNTTTKVVERHRNTERERLRLLVFW